MRTRSPSFATTTLLAALLQQPQAYRYGYELTKTTGLGSGTLYPILARLHERGLLEGEWRPAVEVGRPPRHAYRLTKAGIEFAVKHALPEAHPKGAPTRSKPA